MLPSKGYFKSLNCPYFLNGFCNRPHCHFRHTRKDKVGDENQQLEDLDHSSRTDSFSDVVEETSSDNSWPSSQQSSSASFSYKPTPIVELKKRHIPINTAPSFNSQKRRIEYDIKGIKKPKVKYVPEALNTESHSRSVCPANVTSTVYRATKICGNSDQVLNGGYSHENVPFQDTEESEGEIDFDQVSNELNFLDEILKEYEKPICLKNLLKESSSNDTDALIVEKEQINSKSEVFSDKFGNGFTKDPQIPAEKIVKKSSTESDYNSNETIKRKSSSESDFNSNETKKIIDCENKSKSDLGDLKSKTDNETSSNAEKSKRRRSTSNSLSDVKGESKSSSEHRRKSTDHHKSDGDRNKKKEKCNDSSSLSKTAKKDLGSESSFDKLLKSDPNKSIDQVKLIKKDSSSGSTNSSKKKSEHKSSSSKSSRKDSERESKSNKSSTKESEQKTSSSKSHKIESDNQSKSSKSKSEHKSSKRTHSPERHSSSKKHKSNNNADHKHHGEKKSSKYKDENKHRKESNEKRRSKEDKSSNSKESRTKERRDSGNKEKMKQIHSVSDSEGSSDVEIISEPGSIIVIDSEEDTGSEKSSERRTMEKKEWPSPTHSSGLESPDEEAQQEQEHEIKIPPSQDDSALLDHRVQSRIKNRVSLGATWRPPTRKPVEIMTPAQRLLLFSRMKEKEQKESDAQANAARVKIGSVPNVQNILKEMEMLMKTTNKNCNAESTKPRLNCASTAKENRLLPPIDEKDVVPTAPLVSKHPTSRGANLFTRREMLDRLYRVHKQLLEPNKPLKEARDKCLQDESKIWLATNTNEYEKEINKLIDRLKGEIPNFTLRYFTQIRSSFQGMFPQELRKKVENGREPSPPTHEESLYSRLVNHILNENQLEEEGYPRKKGESRNVGYVRAYISESHLNKWKKARPNPPTGEYACSNCNKFYSVDENGLSLSRWECRYHAKKSCITMKDRSGQLERRARCCNNDVSSPCMTSEYHSTETRDLQNLDGFMETKPPVGDMPPEGWGIYSLDCEMYWSTRGSELGRVTVVNIDCRVVYDTFVKPEFPVTDYTTRMSGLNERNLKNAKKTLRDVQDDLLRIFNAKTILIGHSLENDLKALQIVHHTVVDTAIVYKNGEYKLALKTLASDHLKEVIQNEEQGHDSAEDAITCIKLMVRKVIKDAIAQSKKAPPAPRERYKTHTNL